MNRQTVRYTTVVPAYRLEIQLESIRFAALVPTLSPGALECTSNAGAMAHNTVTPDHRHRRSIPLPNSEFPRFRPQTQLTPAGADGMSTSTADPTASESTYLPHHTASRSPSRRASATRASVKGACLIYQVSGLVFVLFSSPV